MKDYLQDRLRAWAALHEAKPEQLDALSQRVMSGLARAPQLTTEMPSFRLQFYQKLGYACAGALVAVTALALVALLRPGTGEEDRLSSVCMSSSGQLDRDVTAQKLFKEVSRLFPHQLRWIAQSNGDVGLGLESDATGSIPDTPAMSIRLVVLSRKTSETKWREAWATDIIVHAEDMVDITPSRHSNNRMHFWVFPLENGKVAVETDLALEQPLTLSSRLNTVVEIGKPTEVATVRMGDAEYKIFQTVKPLNNAGNVPS